MTGATLALAGVVACTRETDPPSVDLAALRDPQTCEECHPIHYREWLGSMHAHASEDPGYFCHQVTAVEGTHNNPLRLAMDAVSRACSSGPRTARPLREAWSTMVRA